MRRCLALVATHKTDVLELQIGSLEAGWLDDIKAATTLAIALRNRLSKTLGLESREIGYAVAEVSPPGEALRQSIFLFDQAEGGAGYVALAFTKWREQSPRAPGGLLDGLEQELSCPVRCDSACHRCLLAYDTDNDFDRIDRALARQSVGLAIEPDI
jgi:hypothetical protein